MSPALQVIIVFGASALLVLGVLVYIVVEILEEHSVNEDLRRIPTITHH